MNIKIANVTKEVNGSVVLNNVNMELESGAVYGLLGKNGSGKTLLLRPTAALSVPQAALLRSMGRSSERTCLSPRV